MKNIYIVVLVVMTSIVLFLNSTFYLVARQEIINEQNEDVQSLANTIKTSIELGQRGTALFEELIVENLRTASVAIQYALPPDYKDVKNEDLKVLANHLMIDDISLFVKDKEDFRGVKSTDPEQIGARTKDWGETWNRMFFQLMDHHEVELEPNFGQALPGFWSGPIDTSSTHPNEVYKWGYYNDGTTNYLIDPFVKNNIISKYEEQAGVDKLIERVVRNDPYLMEIGILNYNTLVGTNKRHPEEVRTNSVFYHNRLLLNGSYNNQTELDKKFASQAVNNNESVSDVVVEKGKKILKTYIPLPIKIDGNINNDQVIAIASSDYDLMMTQIIQDRVDALVSSGFCFLIGFLVILGFSKYLKKQAKVLDGVQTMYTQNIERLFNTVKEHRHDFNHHIFTIQGLSSMKMYDELDEYLRGLTKIQTTVNDVITVKIPAISGLVQTKIAESVDKQIDFEHHFEGFERVELDIMMLADLVQVTGNILDNAFHAVQENETGKRKVTLMARAEKGMLVFNVYNNGPKIPAENLPRLFEHGFTTRKNKGGSGLGLASAKKIIEGHKGQIEVSSDEKWTNFILRLPLAKMY